MKKIASAVIGLSLAAAAGFAAQAPATSTTPATSNTPAKHVKKHKKGTKAQTPAADTSTTTPASK